MLDFTPSEHNWNGIEVYPCRNASYKNKENKTITGVEQCEEGAAEFYSVYLHITDKDGSNERVGGLECIADLPTKDLAEKLANVIKRAAANYRPNETYMETAGEVLLPYGTEDDISLVQMVKRINEHKNQDDLIDYVEGVNVWEKLEGKFTCKAFLEYIGFKK